MSDTNDVSAAHTPCPPHVRVWQREHGWRGEGMRRGVWAGGAHGILQLLESERAKWSREKFGVL